MSQTMVGAFDITLLFKKGSEIAPQQMGATDQVSVTLAPGHFKAFVRSVNETLKAYESVYGVLTIPDADINPLKNAEQIAELIEGQRAKGHAQAQAAANLSSSEPPPRAKQSRSSARKKAT
jgi:hypothetical protein